MAPWGAPVIGFTASMEVNSTDLWLSWIGASGVAVGDELLIQLEIEATQIAQAE